MKRGVVVMLLASACTGNPAQTPVPTASAVPAAAATVAITEAPASRTPQAPLSAATVAFPDLPLIAAASSGEIYLLRGGQWVREAQVCPSGQANFSGAVVGFNLSEDGKRAWFRCDPGGPPDRVVHAFVYDLATKTSREVFGTTELGLGPLSPDGRSGVLPLLGVHEAGAPINQNTRVLVDLQTDDRKEILPSDYWFIEMQWTSFGLTYYRPQYGPNHFVRDDAQIGTFRWDGSRWSKVSSYRLIEVRPDGSMLLERRVRLGSATGGETIGVVQRVGTVEREVTPAGKSEWALGIDAQGVSAFRPDSPQETVGSFIRYENGREVAALRGRFSPSPLVRSGDWVVSLDYNSLTGATLLAYSLSQKTTASLRPGISIAALAALRR